MKLEDISTFLKVADFGSFSRAAISLCLSKSVVSFRVSRLERDMDAKLLARTTRGVSLTEAGEVFRRHSLRVFEELELAREEVSDSNEELAGTLSISCALDFGLKCVAPVLPRFLEMHPRLKCYIHYSYENIDLKSGHFDLALRLCRASDPLSNVQIVARSQNFIVGSPALIERVGAPLHPNDLRSKPCLSYDDGMFEVNTWHFDLGNRTIGVAVKGVMRANNMEALRIVAEAGVGFTQMPVSSVWEALHTGDLVAVLPDYPVADLLICADYPPGVNISRAARQFVDFLNINMVTPTMLV